MDITTGPPRWETAAATEHLTRLLNLRDWDQDWAICAADPTRLSEFSDLYESGALDDEGRFALMSLIVASLDDAYSDGTVTEGSAHRVENLLRRDFLLHLHTVYYWALLDESDPDNVFPTTPTMRRIWNDCFRPEYRRWLEDE